MTLSMWTVKTPLTVGEFFVPGVYDTNGMEIRHEKIFNPVCRTSHTDAW
jgi:hypothetical protein